MKKTDIDLAVFEGLKEAFKQYRKEGTVKRMEYDS
jgi:hypothetical protein